MSGSRSSLQLRGSSHNTLPLPDRCAPQFQWILPRLKSVSPPLSTGSPPPAKDRVSIVDLFGEASSDSDGSISMTSGTRDAEKVLLPPVEYDRLAPSLVPRAEWFFGYRDRVSWSHQHVHPWSARRFSMTCVAELDVDILFKHHLRPKGYSFPAPTAPRCKATPPESDEFHG